MKTITVALWLAASVAGAQQWSGVWVGGTTATGSPGFVQLELKADGGTLEVPSQEVVIPVTHVQPRADGVAFDVPTGFGLYHADLKADGATLLRGTMHTPDGRDATLHLRRTAPDRVRASDYAGMYTLPGGERVIATARTSGQLRVVGTATTSLSMRLVPLDRDRFLDGATIIATPDSGREVTFQRDEKGNVVSVTTPAAIAKREDLIDQEPVTFRNGSIAVAGTFLVPRTPAPHPAAVVVHGSGPITRDILLQRAQLLLRDGIAVLLYDKRGTGESTGSWEDSSFEDLAGDAAAGIAYLRTRKDVDPAQIGIMGHSQAGWIIPIVASRDPKIAFALIASGGGVSPEEQEIYRAEKAGGAQAKELMTLEWHYGRTGEGWDDYLKAWQAAGKQPWFGSVAAARTPDDPMWARVRRYATYDPLPYLKALRTPTLVVLGAEDSVVPPERAAALWRASGCTACDVVTVPRAGHNLMVKDRSGAYVFSPEYVDAMKQWLRKRGVKTTDVF